MHAHKAPSLEETKILTTHFYIILLSEPQINEKTAIPQNPGLGRFDAAMQKLEFWR